MYNALAGLIIFLVFLPAVMAAWDVGVVATQQRLAADHLQAVTRASVQYVRKNQTRLLTSTSATSGPVISVAELVQDKLLPVGFQEQNLWKQNYQIYMRQPEPKALQAIVLTREGRTVTTKFANVTVPGAAALVGGAGGYIPSGVLPGQSADQLVSAGWAINLASMGIASSGPGHMGALTSFDTSSFGQDYLYRVAVPGNPEVNEMSTELDMTEHAIRNISEMQFTERKIDTESCANPEEQGRVFLDKEQGLYLCRNNALEIIGDTGNGVLFKKAILSKNADTIEKPVCPPNTDTVPMIFVSPSIAEAGPEAPPISSFQTWATSLSDTQWQVHLRVLTSSKKLSADDSGWVYPAEDYGRIMTMTMCAKDVVVTP